MALAILTPGCIDIPTESKALVTLFIVLLSFLIVLNAFLIVLLLFYFLPFTKPGRKRRKK
jgi:maltodextrin utilization protein YvdJ